MITINVKCDPEENAGSAIRTLFCQEAAAKPQHNRNPLVETKFNDLLASIAQSAFDAGRSFEKKNPKLVD